MRTVIILFIRLYQIILSPLVHTMVGPTAGCRFEQSCSEYAIDAIKKYGVMNGGRMSIIRFLHCQPFYTNARP